MVISGSGTKEWSRTLPIAFFVVLGIVPWVNCSAGPTTKPVPVFHSVNEVMAKLPPDDQPDRWGHWDQFNQPAAQKWFEENMAGATLDTYANLDRVTVVRVHDPGAYNETMFWGVLVTFQEMEITYFHRRYTVWLAWNSPDHYGMSWAAVFGDQEKAKAWTLLPSRYAIRVRGTISRVLIGEANPPVIAIVFSDASIPLPNELGKEADPCMGSEDSKRFLSLKEIHDACRAAPGVNHK